MHVNQKKENLTDYSSKLSIGFIPRVLFVTATRPVSAYKKASYMLGEMWAYRRLKKTSAGAALDIISAENRKLGTETDQYGDIWRLYKHVLRTKNNVVWEFGPGWTTVGLAAALVDSGKGGKVYAMEANKEWYDWYKPIYDKLDPKLKDTIELIYSPVEVTHDYDQPAVRHTVLPDEKPSFIHIDGRGQIPDVKVACDIVDKEFWMPNHFTVVMDGRVKQLRFLQRNLKRLNKHEKPLFSSGLLQPVLKVKY
jgi:hypothetical protein